MKTTNGRLWSTLDNCGIEIRSLTLDKLDAALDILNDSFFPNESICIATEINLPSNRQARRELRELCRQAAEDGVSIIAIEKATGNPVAVAFNKLQWPTNESEGFFNIFRDKYTHSPEAKALMNFMIDVDAMCKVFDKFNLSSVCELMFLATSPNWRRRGIAHALTKYTIALTKEISEGLINNKELLDPKVQNVRPQAVMAIFSSQFSQKIGESLGFQILNKIPYTKFSYNGVLYSDRINPIHKHCEHVIYLL